MDGDEQPIEPISDIGLDRINDIMFNDVNSWSILGYGCLVSTFDFEHMLMLGELLLDTHEMWASCGLHTAV